MNYLTLQNHKVVGMYCLTSVSIGTDNILIYDNKFKNNRHMVGFQVCIHIIKRVIPGITCMCATDQCHSQRHGRATILAEPLISFLSKSVKCQNLLFITE